MNPLRALSEPSLAHALFCAPSTRRAGTAPAGEGLSNGIDPGAEGFGKHLRQAHEAHLRPHGPDHDVLHAAARQAAQLALAAAACGWSLGPELSPARRFSCNRTTVEYAFNSWPQQALTSMHGVPGSRSGLLRAGSTSSASRSTDGTTTPRRGHA